MIASKCTIYSGREILDQLSFTTPSDSTNQMVIVINGPFEPRNPPRITNPLVAQAREVPPFQRNNKELIIGNAKWKGMELGAWWKFSS